MNKSRNHHKCFAIGICVAGYLVSLPAQQNAEQPETVMVSLHAKAGSEADLERVIANHWNTAHRMKLVRDAPHLTIRRTEDKDKTVFIDIFTWRDAHIPDTAPEEIQKIWSEMNQLVESRAGHPGLEFTEVSIVAP